MLNNRVKVKVVEKLEQYEGRVPHLYLDTKGYVTVGVGHMLPNKSAVTAVRLYKSDSHGRLSVATASEKEAEYDVIKKLLFGDNYSAHYYRRYATLTMRDDDINAQREAHIASFYKELSGYYTTGNGFMDAFDDMPEEVQMALFDMIFNLGLPKLKNQYILFHGHLRKRGWREAAGQSSRIGIGLERNKYVHDLLMIAARNQKTVAGGHI